MGSMPHKPPFLYSSDPGRFDIAGFTIGQLGAGGKVNDLLVEGCRHQFVSWHCGCRLIRCLDGPRVFDAVHPCRRHLNFFLEMMGGVWAHKKKKLTVRAFSPMEDLSKEGSDLA